MPTYVAPNNDEQRRAQLQEAAAQALRDQTEGSAILTTEHTAALTALAQSFSQLLDARFVAEQTAQVRRQAFAEAVKAMKTELKQAWMAVRDNVARETWPVTTAAYYLVPLSESLDYPATPKEWLKAGQNTLRGDSLADAQGLGGLSNRAQLQAACEAAAAALQAQQTAEEALVAARQAVNDQRLVCDQLLKRVISYLRYSTRLQSPVEMRRLLRAYGGQFRYRQNEPANGESHPAELPLAG